MAQIERVLTVNLAVLKKSRRVADVGGIFAMKPPDGQYVFGRVISTDANPLGVGGAVLIYDEFEEEAVLCVRRPWEADADAHVCLLSSDLSLPATVKALGYEYFLEVSVANEVLGVLNEGTPTGDEKLQLLLHYAENDAYREILYPTEEVLMGAFNIVHTAAVCPSCQARVPVVVQFKYGKTWQLEYDIGDELRWGGNQIGSPGKTRVVVEGVAESPCPACGYDNEWNLYLNVENDRLVSAETATGKYNFAKEGSSFVEE